MTWICFLYFFFNS
ncbi:putative membrane protein, partial [Chlamydia psittaci 84-8471/1]